MNFRFFADDGLSGGSEFPPRPTAPLRTLSYDQTEYLVSKKSECMTPPKTAAASPAKKHVKKEKEKEKEKQTKGNIDNMAFTMASAAPKPAIEEAAKAKPVPGGGKSANEMIAQLTKKKTSSGAASVSRARQGATDRQIARNNRRQFGVQPEKTAREERSDRADALLKKIAESEKKAEEDARKAQEAEQEAAGAAAPAEETKEVLPDKSFEAMNKPWSYDSIKTKAGLTPRELLVLGGHLHNTVNLRDPRWRETASGPISAAGVQRMLEEAQKTAAHGMSSGEINQMAKALLSKVHKSGLSSRETADRLAQLLQGLNLSIVGATQYYANTAAKVKCYDEVSGAMKGDAEMVATHIMMTVQRRFRTEPEKAVIVYSRVARFFIALFMICATIEDTEASEEAFLAGRRRARDLGLRVGKATQELSRELKREIEAEKNPTYVVSCPTIMAETLLNKWEALMVPKKLPHLDAPDTEFNLNDFLASFGEVDFSPTVNNASASEYARMLVVYFSYGPENTEMIYGAAAEVASDLRDEIAQRRVLVGFSAFVLEALAQQTADRTLIRALYGAPTRDGLKPLPQQVSELIEITMQAEPNPREQFDGFLGRELTFVKLEQEDRRGLHHFDPSIDVDPIAKGVPTEDPGDKNVHRKDGEVFFDNAEEVERDTRELLGQTKKPKETQGGITEMLGGKPMPNITDVLYVTPKTMEAKLNLNRALRQAIRTGDAPAGSILPQHFIVKTPEGPVFIDGKPVPGGGLGSIRLHGTNQDGVRFFICE